MTHPFHYTWVWELKSSPEALWPLVSNTDRFNGATGVSAIRYQEVPLEDGGSRRIITQNVYGVRLVYEEDPFEWVYAQQLQRASRYHPALLNPLREFRVLMRLEPGTAGGTRLTYETWTTPANALGLLAIPIQINGLFRRKFGQIFREMDATIQKKRDLAPIAPRHTPLTSAGRTRIEEISRAMYAAKQNPTIVSMLINLITKAPDLEIARLRPYVLADRYGFDRREMLEICLRATRAGLLDLSWDMICPDCRGAKHRSLTLEGITQYGHCPSCNIDFEVDFAKSVEATFQVNPAIRPVVYEEFCIGSPQRSPHIVLQQRLQPGETRTLTVRLEPGSYRWIAPKITSANPDPRTPESALQALRGQAQMRVTSESHNKAIPIIIDDELTMLQQDVMPGQVTFTLTNETKAVQQLSLGRNEWSDQSATAADITALQLFRDQFSSEVLRPGESIRISNLTVLFTDLKGSTSMYRTFGDAAVFKLVMDHFDILRMGVDRYHGSQVKTIGDAIMAVFIDPEDAVRAALDILTGIAAYNQTNGTLLTMKMGINSGAAIVVTLNERLDYFGSTVNLAARLESLSNGDDMILSEGIAADPGVIALLSKTPVQTESFEATLKGFSLAVPVRRVRLGALESIPVTG